MTLTLSARIESTNPCHAEIGVFQNGGKAGVLRVQAEHAKEILGILNAGPQLLAACRVCDSAISELVDAARPTSTDWINIRAARHLARMAIEGLPPEELTQHLGPDGEIG